MLKYTYLCVVHFLKTQTGAQTVPVTQCFCSLSPFPVPANSINIISIPTNNGPIGLQHRNYIKQKEQEMKSALFQFQRTIPDKRKALTQV